PRQPFEVEFQPGSGSWDGLFGAALQEHCLYHANHDHSDMMKTPYTLDLVLELNGEWHDKQRIAGIPDPNSGGTTVYPSPGVRMGFDRFSGFVSAGCHVSKVTVWLACKRSDPARSSLPPSE